MCITQGRLAAPSSSPTPAPLPAPGLRKSAPAPAHPQAKAGQPDAAFATYRRMLAAGATPNSWTFSMLVSACGRARQPGRASDVVERLMPQVNVDLLMLLAVALLDCVFKELLLVLLAVLALNWMWSA